MPSRFLSIVLFFLCLPVFGTLPPQDTKQAPPIRFKWWTNEKMIRQLSLTQQQVDKIESIWTERRKSLDELEADVGRQEKDLKANLDQEQVNEKAVEFYIDRLYHTRAELEKGKLRLRFRIRDVLNKDQQKQIHEMVMQFRRDREKERAEKEKAKGGGGRPPEKPPERP